MNRLEGKMTEEAIPKRILGSTGIVVSGLGVGCWGIGGEDFNLGLPMGWSGAADDASIAGLEEAYRLGANLFDTADVYGHGRSERLIGRLVKQVPRTTLVLTSKVGYFAGTAQHGYDPGHMRRQLEQTLDNMATDYLDIYFLHHANFGPHDEYLDGAIEAMNQFKREGLIKTVGMRGPHRFALDRIRPRPELSSDKVGRFHSLFNAVQPEVIAVRDNLLTPTERSAGLFAFADENDCGILINKPLAQGLLTGKHSPDEPPKYGDGDHRLRKRWFKPAALSVLEEGLGRARAIVGPSRTDLIRICLWACLVRSPRAAVLVGFMTPEQIRENLTCLGNEPPANRIAEVRAIMAEVQSRLDAEGEVFVDQYVEAMGDE
jgi:aryl-alcohol dehydrogenase-like predicted oxidoreductase